MINVVDVIKESMKEQNPNWPEIPDYPYRILIVLDLEKQIHYLIW